MGSMTDERRKEMEQEMMRFELEIFTRDEDDENAVGKPVKKAMVQETETSDTENNLVLPNTVEEIIKTAMVEQPPPPPDGELEDGSGLESSSNLGSDILVSNSLLPPGSQQAFIPQQVQRANVRPPPQFAQPSMPPQSLGPMMPFPPMSAPPMPPMPPMRMPMPPGYCPPPPGIGPGPMRMPQRPFMPPPPPPPMSMQYREPVIRPPQKTTTATKVVKSQATFSCAPTVYAAPPVKHIPPKRQITPVPANGQKTEIEKPIIASLQGPTEPKIIKTFVETIITTSVPVSTVATPTPTYSEMSAPSRKKEKKKKIVRMGGGQAWEDNSLMEWENDDFRIFCGDLGNDVTDEVLIRAFSKYPSFGKAKVIRDKRTNKTKGYGFVSFKDPQDFIKAMREMNGRYVGSRPIKLRKSTWKDRNIDIVRKKQKEKEKLGLL